MSRSGRGDGSPVGFRFARGGFATGAEYRRAGRDRRGPLRIRRFIAIGLAVAATAVVTATGAQAARPETAQPGDSARLSHVVAAPVRGGAPTGVPGQAGKPGSTSKNGISYH